MQIDENLVTALLDRPTEGLNVEIKSWFDPREPEGKRMFIRAAFAIRNRNGGFIVIGFNNDTLKSDPYQLSDPIQTVFHFDYLQALISKYALEPFEINIALRELNGQEHPVIIIPEGVKVPAIVKSSLNGYGRKSLLAEGDIFFRTLNSNGTPSSAKILPRDYPELLEICFENREADIGRFLRRHLGSGELAQMVEALSGISRPSNPTLKDRALAVIESGIQALETTLKSRTLSENEKAALNGLTMHVGLALEPEHTDALPTGTFINSIAGANPQYSGWPVWLDSRGFPQQADRAVVVDNAWQALIVDVNGGWSQHLEFMRLDPTGNFYLRRAMQDDLNDRAVPGSVLDPILMLYRVIEVLAVGISLARATGWSADDKAAFAFRWDGLNGRRLSSWVNPMHFLEGGTSATNLAQGFTEVRLDTPHSALAPYVRNAVGPMFVTFSGYEPSLALIEDCVKRLVERNMQ